MKKKFFSFLLVITVCLTLVACAGANQTTSDENATDTVQTEKPAETNDEVVSNPTEPTVEEKPEVLAEEETIHEHNYVESVVKEVTCLEDGTAKYTCECGDTYEGKIEPLGHDFSEYIADGNATYLADGTKTAVCANCGEKDTVADEGSKLAYTYTDLSAQKYAQQTVNVRDLPSTDGNKVGSLSTNQEVTVTGQCNETSWYRIDYNGSVAYVSNKYLGDNKVEVATNSGSSDTGNSGGSNTSSVPNPYELPTQTWIDLGDWFLYIQPSLDCPDNNVDSPFWQDKVAILRERYPNKTVSGRQGIRLNNGTWTAWTIDTYDGTIVNGAGAGYPQSSIDFVAIYQYH